MKGIVLLNKGTVWCKMYTKPSRAGRILSEPFRAKMYTSLYRAGDVAPIKTRKTINTKVVYSLL